MKSLAVFSRAYSLMNGDYLINTVPEDVSGGEIGWDTTDVKPAVPGWFLRNGFFRTPFYHHPALEWCWCRHRRGPQDLTATAATLTVKFCLDTVEKSIHRGFR